MAVISVATKVVSSTTGWATTTASCLVFGGKGLPVMRKRSRWIWFVQKAPVTFEQSRKAAGLTGGGFFFGG